MLNIIEVKSITDSPIVTREGWLMSATGAPCTYRGKSNFILHYADATTATYEVISSGKSYDMFKNENGGWDIYPAE